MALYVRAGKVVKRGGGLWATLSSNTAFLTWDPPTQTDAGDSFTPTNHIIYASQNPQDWDDITGLAPVFTGSALGAFNYTNAAFTPGTTWYFWARAIDDIGSQSATLIIGPKVFT